MLAPAPQRQPPPRLVFGSSIPRSSTRAPGHCGRGGPPTSCSPNPVSSMSLIKLARNSPQLYFPRYFDSLNLWHITVRVAMCGCLRSNPPSAFHPTPSLSPSAAGFGGHAAAVGPPPPRARRHTGGPRAMAVGGGWFILKGSSEQCAPIDSMLDNDARQNCHQCKNSPKTMGHRAIYLDHSFDPGVSHHSDPISFAEST